MTSAGWNAARTRDRPATVSRFRPGRGGRGEARADPPEPREHRVATRGRARVRATRTARDAYPHASLMARGSSPAPGGGRTHAPGAPDPRSERFGMPRVLV